MAEDYCDFCDLPKSQCIHGQPPPPPAPPKASAPRRTSASRPAAVREVSQPAPSKVTARSAFRPHILAMLQEAGEPLETAEALADLEARLDDVLQSRDREKSPTGEVRWHTSARAERKAMIDEGLMVAAKPGVWQLT